MKGRVEQNSGSYKRLRLYSWLQSCAVALLVTAAVFVLWFQSIQITDTGMAPVCRTGTSSSSTGWPSISIPPAGGTPMPLSTRRAA